jgi:hypothetical protein
VELLDQDIIYNFAAGKAHRDSLDRPHPLVPVAAQRVRVDSERGRTGADYRVRKNYEPIFERFVGDHETFCHTYICYLARTPDGILRSNCGQAAV